jgi:hypothetical protein
MATITKRQIVGGNFQGPDGSPLNGGQITFHLSVDASASGNQISAGVITTATLDSSGNISGTVSLWPNDHISPDTVYRVSVYTASGELCWKSENVVPSGAGSFDIGTWIPL